MTSDTLTRWPADPLAGALALQGAGLAEELVQVDGGGGGGGGLPGAGPCTRSGWLRSFATRVLTLPFVFQALPKTCSTTVGPGKGGPEEGPAMRGVCKGALGAVRGANKSGA